MHSNKDFCALGLVVVVVLITRSVVTLGDDSNKKIQKVTFESDADKTQEISIFVQPRAETGDSGSVADETDPNDESVASSIDDCDEGCCFQYTWAGPDLPVPTTTVNNTCEWLKSSKGKAMACFDPLVYIKDEANQKGGSGPNLEELKEGARTRPDWKIYCKRGNSRSCMRYRFYRNSKAKELMNETLFCGTVFETNSGKDEANGCFREKIAGVEREICVCDRDLCNEGERKYLNLVLFTSTFFLTLIFSQWTFH